MNFTMESTSQAPFVNVTKASNGSLSPNNTTTNGVGGFTTEGIMKAFSVVILIFFSIAGNLVVCISFTMFRNLRSVTNYFLVSLSISDILIGSCTMPFWMLVQLHQPHPFFKPDQVTLYKAWQAMDFFLCLTTVCCLTAISVERNLAISRPFYYTKWVSPTRVYITIAFLWLFSFAVAMVTAVNPFGKTSNLSIFIVVTSYFIPLLIMFAMYINILLVARRQARRLRQDGALATDLKAIKTIAIVVGTFFVCYTPYMIIIIWVHFRISRVAYYTVSIVKWLTYFNSCVNPIIYSCFNKTYRRGFKRLFQTIAKKLHDMRVRVGDNNNACSSRKLQRSRLSLNITMRSSAGSLLDSTKVPSASVQSRGAVHFVSHVAANRVDTNEGIPDKHLCYDLKPGLACEPTENIVQDTQQ